MRLLLRGLFLIVFIVGAIAVGGYVAYRLDRYHPDYDQDARTTNRAAEAIRSRINDLVVAPIITSESNPDSIYLQTKGDDVRACRITNTETLTVECGEWSNDSEDTEQPD